MYVMNDILTEEGRVKKPQPLRGFREAAAVYKNHKRFTFYL